MKFKSLTQQLISVSLLGLSISAVAGPTLYGKANISLNKHDAEDTTGTTEDNWQLNSNASRLGVKGDVELEDGLKAIYQLEYEIAVDDGEFGSKVTVDVDVAADCDDDDTTKNESCVGSGTGTGSGITFKQRNIFVGIEGDFGQVIAGMHDTPLKLSQGKIDRFNDLHLGDIKEVLSGENRAKNIVMYTSPSMGDFEASLAFIPGEGSAATDDNGIADAFSSSITYTQEAFWLSLAADSEVAGMDNTRLSAEYSFEKAKVAAMLQSGEDVAGTTDSTGYLVSAQYSLDDRWIVKGQYSANTDDSGAAEIDTSMFTAGADYKLGKNAIVFAYASSWETDAADEEQSTFGLGTEVKF